MTDHAKMKRELLKYKLRDEITPLANKAGVKQTAINDAVNHAADYFELDEHLAVKPKSGHTLSVTAWLDSTRVDSPHWYHTTSARTNAPAVVSDLSKATTLEEKRRFIESRHPHLVQSA